MKVPSINAISYKLWQEQGCCCCCCLLFQKQAVNRSAQCHVLSSDRQTGAPTTNIR